MIPPEPPQPDFTGILNALAQAFAAHQQNASTSPEANINQQAGAYPAAQAIANINQMYQGFPPPPPHPFGAQPQQRRVNPLILNGQQRAALGALIAAWAQPRNLRFPFVPPNYRVGGRY